MAWNVFLRYCVILVAAYQGFTGDCTAANITTTVGPSSNRANDCPVNCLGRKCTFFKDGSVDCTDGCNDGYMGKTCDFSCMNKCSKCERSKTNEECIKCDQGYFGKQCHKCPNACGGQGCLSDGICKKDCSAIHVCGDKCLPGCEKCNETLGKCQKCAYNLRGENCKTSCSDNCRPVCQAQNCESPCERTTGRCLHGCKPGFWGELCADQCSSRCLHQNCNQTSGNCTECIRGYHGVKCHLPCVNCKDSGCLQSSGTCKKCDPGYYGHTCTQICVNCPSKVCDRNSGLCMNVSLTTMDIAMATTVSDTSTKEPNSLSVLWKYFVPTSLVLLVLLCIGVLSYRFYVSTKKKSSQSTCIPKYPASGFTRPPSEHHYDEINETLMDSSAGRVSVVVVRLPEILQTDSTSHECLLPLEEKSDGNSM